MIKESNMKSKAAFWLILMILFSPVAVYSLLAQSTGPAMRNQARLDIYVDITDNFDATSPEIQIRYSHVSGIDQCQLRLPNEVEMTAFKNFYVIADGKKLPLVRKGAELDEPAFSRKVDLKVGQSASLTVPVGKIYEIPKDWRELEIVPTRSEVPLPGYTFSLRIKNETK